MISILVQALSRTQTPMTPPSPHLRPIYTLHHSQSHHLYKLTPPTVVALSLISHGRVSTSSDTNLRHHIVNGVLNNHLCIVYVIPGKNWHLVVLNFKFFISYRPWVEQSTGSVVLGRQQRCGYGHFRELTWYLNDVHHIIIMFCASPSCVMMIIARLLNIWHLFSPFCSSPHRRFPERLKIKALSLSQLNTSGGRRNM